MQIVVDFPVHEVDLFEQFLLMMFQFTHHFSKIIIKVVYGKVNLSAVVIIFGMLLTACKTEHVLISPLSRRALNVKSNVTNFPLYLFKNVLCKRLLLHFVDFIVDIFGHLA